MTPNPTSFKLGLLEWQAKRRLNQIKLIATTVIILNILFLVWYLK